jgi:hypothetical protein
MADPADIELMINRFNRLVKELLQGEVRRNCFQPWEVDLLIDLQACGLTRSRREEVLRRYQRAVQRQLESGQIPPVRFSEFISPSLRKDAPPPGVPLSAEDPTSLNP